MTSARRAAYNALRAVTKDKAYTALALKKHIPDNISDSDKKFASLLLRTTLENLIRIDYAVKIFIKSGRVHGSVKDVLRLGACQILYLNTEPYAAISESVKLVKQIKPQMSGFVNAVLRSLAKNKDKIEYPIGDTAQALGISTSYPLWICEKYIADFGFDFTKKLLSYKPDPGTTVRMNPLRTDTDTFLQTLNKLNISYKKGSIPDSYIFNGLTDIENTEIYQKGWMAVQSESAMNAVLSAGIKAHDRLLDCCAAPGGKSAYAAALCSNTLDITAWDVHDHRIDMTKKNFERLGVKNASVFLHDAREYDKKHAVLYGVVIVDAPCSAMGLMAKNPDIRYNRTPDDIAELSKVQYDILSVCANYVKKGGTLAYFTCSINKEENEQVTDRVISKNSAFSYKSAPVTLYPHTSCSDGFYIAVMKKTYE